MNESNPHGHSPDNAHRSHRPYWKRAHRDWRIWVGVIVMLIAMFVYLASGNLHWRLQGQPQPPVPAALETRPVNKSAGTILYAGAVHLSTIDPLQTVRMLNDGFHKLCPVLPPIARVQMFFG